MEPREERPRRGSKRPKDRADQIINAAARLFCERGYSAVSLDDIGEVVGITGPAVYRHFDSKEALLVVVTERMVDRYSTSFMETVATTNTPEDRLVALVERTVGSQVEEVNFWVASSELKHVSRELVQYIGEKRSMAIQVWIDVLLELHPFLSSKEATFMVECGTCMTTPTLLFYQPQLSRTRVVDILSRMMLAAFVLGPEGFRRDGRDASSDVPVLGVDDRDVAVPERPARRASARERILGISVRMFREYGFRRTGIDDIGKEAGVSGPAVYRHFQNKDDILVTAMARANEQLAIGVNRALAAATTSDDALARLVDAYIDAVTEDPDLMAVYWSQREALPAEQRAGIQRGERSFIQDWVGVLREVRPDTEEAEARTMVYGVLGLMNGYWQSPSAALPPDTARSILSNIVMAALRQS